MHATSIYRPASKVLLSILKTITEKNRQKMLKMFHTGYCQFKKRKVTTEKILRLRKLFHQWQLQLTKTKHEMDILRVWKLLKVGSFPCRKMKQKVGSLQVLKVIHQGCCQIGKINSGVNILQCQNVFITITLHQAQKSTLSFTTCIINSASANENIMAQVTEMFYPRIMVYC